MSYGTGDDGQHEAACLTLDNAKACAALGVTPVQTLAEAVARTMQWYRALKEGGDARALCEADIAYFDQRARGKAVSPASLASAI